MQLLSKLSKSLVVPTFLNNYRVLSTLSNTTQYNHHVQKQNSKNKYLFLKNPLIKYHKLDLFSTFKSRTFATPKSVAKFHAIDGLSSKSFTLIYRSDFQWYLIIAQITVFLAIGAVITTLVAVILQSQIKDETSVEEKQEKKASRAAHIMEREKINRNEIPILFGIKEATEPGVVENVPSIADISLSNDDIEYMAFFLLMLTTLGLCIFRLMTMLPVRIYVGKKNHCIGIYYGSLIPGRLVRQDFVAGTLIPQKNAFGARNIYFKDGSGRSLVLFDHFFRQQVDFDYIVGISNTFDYEESDELSQLKRMGSFGSDSPNNKRN